MKCRSAGMVKEWVLSAYNLQKGEPEKKKLLKLKADNIKKLDNDIETSKGNSKDPKCVVPNYYSPITEERVKDMIKKDTLSDSVDKKVNYAHKCFLRF